MIEEVDDLRDVSASWLENILGYLDCSADQLSPARCKKPNKDDIATWLCDSLTYVSKQNTMLKNFRSENEALKTQLISSQQQVVKLQDELLQIKTDQLQCVQSAVRTSVKDSVKAEFGTYSSILQTQPQVLAPEAVKTLIKTVVQEEDRSRSLMIFGLPEEEEEQLCDRISQVFQEVGEKPRIEASRLGQTRKEGKVRPVKVTVSSSTIVNQILTKARNLKQSEKHSKVFICPDRSPVQRAEHKQMVAELKEKAKEDTSMRHFIRGGKICSASIKPN